MNILFVVVNPSPENNSYSKPLQYVADMKLCFNQKYQDENYRIGTDRSKAAPTYRKPQS